MLTLHEHKNIAVWSGGSASADFDIWLLPAFGDSHLCYREIFAHPIAERMRIFLFDLPGHGFSPPRPTGLTIEEAALICRDLIVNFSSSRRIVMVVHSMAAIIATLTAQMKDCSPSLLISVEGNLTLADAYLSGKAANFAEPQSFYTWFQAQIIEKAEHDEILRRYSCSLQFADPNTLWTLGRSVLNYPNCGQDFLDLTCRTIYYWDPVSSTKEAKEFLAVHKFHQRKTEGVGHWPMVHSPSQFYAAVEEDVFRDA